VHILLTDLLTCPRCGPRFGLILLADELADRRVLEGRLGCPNCRQSYPITGGVADLRNPVVPSLPERVALRGDPERAFRTAALLGETRANSTVLVISPSPETTVAMSEFLPMVHLVSASDSEIAGESEQGVVSATRVGGKLPFRDRAFQGVAILGIAPEELIGEAARVLAAAGRLVVEPAEGFATTFAAAGLQLHLEQEGVIVAAHRGPP